MTTSDSDALISRIAELEAELTQVKAQNEMMKLVIGCDLCRGTDYAGSLLCSKCRGQDPWKLLKEHYKLHQIDKDLTALSIELRTLQDVARLNYDKDSLTKRLGEILLKIDYLEAKRKNEIPPKRTDIHSEFERIEKLLDDGRKLAEKVDEKFFSICDISSDDIEKILANDQAPTQEHMFFVEDLSHVAIYYSPALAAAVDWARKEIIELRKKSNT